MASPSVFPHCHPGDGRWGIEGLCESRLALHGGDCRDDDSSGIDRNGWSALAAGRHANVAKERESFMFLFVHQ